VTLTGGSSQSEGNVLVNGRPVCDDYWSDENAGVICKMLGYDGGVGVSGSYFGNTGSGFVMDDVVCTGSEASIMDCWHQTTHNCAAREAAGVICEEDAATTTTPRPAADDHKGEQNNETPFKSYFALVTLVGGSSVTEGNVYIDGRPVCDDFWSQNDAIVICKMLGFVGGTPTVQSHFGTVRTNFGMDNVLCDGTESTILDCPHDTSHNCGQNEGAGVKCTQGKKFHFIDLALPFIISVWLMGGHEGNVFINSQPVCDDFWDQSDALVVCRMLGYSGGIPKSGSHFGTVSTNYAMDDVFCTGSEPSLLECPHSTSHNCEANEGAGVICFNGKLSHYILCVLILCFRCRDYNRVG
jgi:hypothetical protein